MSSLGRINRWRRQLGVTLFAISLLSITAPVSAEQRLVRVIWDIGTTFVYVKVDTLTTPSQDQFVLPANATDATQKNGFKKREDTRGGFLRKGDRVRLYIVNYNPVAHTWSESSSSIEQIVRSPSPVGPILSATVLALVGVKAPPTTTTIGSFNAWKSSDAAVQAVPDCEKNLKPITDDLDAFAKQVTDLGVAASNLNNSAKTFALDDAAKTLTKLPASPEMWAEFKDASAWAHIRLVVGTDFAAHLETLAAQAKTFGDGVSTANDALLKLDQTIAETSLDQACATAAKPKLTRRENLIAVVHELAGSDAPVRSTITTLKAAGELWETYKTKLDDRKWTDEAVELAMNTPLQAESVLRIDAVFVSPDKNSVARVHQTLVLEIAPYFPVLAITAGVGANFFDFKQLQLVKATTTDGDGSVVAKSQLRMVDDTSWQPIVPVWLENIRLKSGSSVGLYGTFGTTPDRNIFKNAILGGTILVRRWKTAFTAGLIAAPGYTKDDLQPVINQFSDDSGFALADVTASNVPLEPASWKRSFFLSAAFVLAGF